MRKRRIFFGIMFLFAFALIIFNSGIISSQDRCILTPDLNCPSGYDCETCPAGCPCIGDTICVDGACVTLGQSQTTCLYHYFFTSNCDNKCPSGYPCTEIIHIECTQMGCDIDTCWCEVCSIEHTGTYICASLYQTAYTCSFSFNEDTDCDGWINNQRYPLKKQNIISISPSSRDFGAVLVGSCSSTTNFDVSNPSSSPSINLVGSASVSAPFSCVSGCSYDLPPGQSQTVKIEFCPTSEASYSRTVSFSGGTGATTTVIGQGDDPAVYYILSITKTGSGSGTVTGSGINCGTICSKDYESDTSVTLSASSDSGSTFAGWSGACSGTGNCIVTMTSAKSVTATFDLESPGTHTLTVSKSGSGTVTSSPAGINCGTDCSESYVTGTEVTLSASAATDYTFTGWSGACSGTGNCIVTMDSGKTVTATFTLTGVPSECDLTSASWSSTEVEEGTTVEMNVGGSNCTDEALIFSIKRGSTLIETIYDIFPSSSWTASPASGTPYYFIVSVIGNPTETETSNNLLVTDIPDPTCGDGTLDAGEECDDGNNINGDGCSSVCLIESPGPYCDGITICSQYESENDCNNNVCEIDIQENRGGRSSPGRQNTGRPPPAGKTGILKVSSH